MKSVFVYTRVGWAVNSIASSNCRDHTRQRSSQVRRDNCKAELRVEGWGYWIARRYDTLAHFGSRVTALPSPW